MRESMREVNEEITDSDVTLSPAVKHLWPAPVHIAKHEFCLILEGNIHGAK